MGGTYERNHYHGNHLHYGADYRIGADEEVRKEKAMFCVIAKRGPDGRFLPSTRIGDEEISRECILDFAAYVAKRFKDGVIAERQEQPAAKEED